MAESAARLRTSELDIPITRCANGSLGIVVDASNAVVKVSASVNRALQVGDTVIGIDGTRLLSGQRLREIITQAPSATEFVFRVRRQAYASTSTCTPITEASTAAERSSTSAKAAAPATHASTVHRRLAAACAEAEEAGSTVSGYSGLEASQRARQAATGGDSAEAARELAVVIKSTAALAQSDLRRHVKEALTRPGPGQDATAAVAQTRPCPGQAATAASRAMSSTSSAHCDPPPSSASDPWVSTRLAPAAVRTLPPTEGESDAAASEATSASEQKLCAAGAPPSCASGGEAEVLMVPSGSDADASATEASSVDSAAYPPPSSAPSTTASTQLTGLSSSTGASTYPSTRDAAVELRHATEAPGPATSARPPVAADRDREAAGAASLSAANNAASCLTPSSGLAQPVLVELLSALEQLPALSLTATQLATMRAPLEQALQRCAALSMHQGQELAETSDESRQALAAAIEKEQAKAALEREQAMARQLAEEQAKTVMLLSSNNACKTKIEGLTAELIAQEKKALDAKQMEAAMRATAREAAAREQILARQLCQQDEQSVAEQKKSERRHATMLKHAVRAAKQQAVEGYGSAPSHVAEEDLSDERSQPAASASAAEKKRRLRRPPLPVEPSAASDTTVTCKPASVRSTAKMAAPADVADVKDVPSVVDHRLMFRRVKLVDLTEHAELNGAWGRVIAFKEKLGMYEVIVDPNSEGRVKQLMRGGKQYNILAAAENLQPQALVAAATASAPSAAVVDGQAASPSPSLPPAGATPKPPPPLPPPRADERTLHVGVHSGAKQAHAAAAALNFGEQVARKLKAAAASEKPLPPPPPPSLAGSLAGSSASLIENASVASSHKEMPPPPVPSAGQARRASPAPFSPQLVLPSHAARAPSAAASAAAVHRAVSPPGYTTSDLEDAHLLEEPHLYGYPADYYYSSEAQSEAETGSEPGRVRAASRPRPGQSEANPGSERGTGCVVFASQPRPGSRAGVQCAAAAAARPEEETKEAGTRAGREQDVSGTRAEVVKPGEAHAPRATRGRSLNASQFELQLPAVGVAGVARLPTAALATGGLGLADYYYSSADESSRPASEAAALRTSAVAAYDNETKERATEAVVAASVVAAAAANEEAEEEEQLKAAREEDAAFSDVSGVPPVPPPPPSSEVSLAPSLTASLASLSAVPHQPHRDGGTDAVFDDELVDVDELTDDVEALAAKEPTTSPSAAAAAQRSTQRRSQAEDHAATLKRLGLLDSM